MRSWYLYGLRVVTFAAAVMWMPMAGAQEVSPDTPHICITEYAEWYQHPAETIGQRLRMYEDMGIEMIRVQTGWESGALIEELAKTRLRIKFILYVLGLPEGYDRPDEAMIDEHGVSDWHFGPWHSDIEEQTRQAADTQMALLERRGILDQIDEVCADLGPAAEGIYPANWTLNRDGAEEAFWCYSPAAQNDFRRVMKDRYETITAANWAWRLEGGEAFADWEAVHIPPPGTSWARGPFWNDMLTWYRDSKRRLMSMQIDHTIAVTRKYLGDRAKVVVYLPGWAYTQEEWDQAVATASGPASIRLMMDNDWLLDEALRRGCILQYTGVENASEVRRIAKKLENRGHKGCRILWGENAGIEVSGRNPFWLAEVIASFDLRGIDYTWSNWIFEADGLTPSTTFGPFRQSVEALRAYYATGTLPVLEPDPERAVTSPEVGIYEIVSTADTRLMGDYPDHMKGPDPEIAVVEGGQSQRILLRFPVDQLPREGAIGQATLRLTGNIDYGEQETVSIHAYRVTDSWREAGVTWMARNLTESWQVPGGDAAGRDGDSLGVGGTLPEPYATVRVGTLAPGEVVAWDLTDLVTQWYTQAMANHGLLLVIEPGGVGNVSVCAREHLVPGHRPTLRVVMARP